MISLFIFLFILGVSIIVHEFGHFIVARRLGIRVEKFALGFGHRLWSRKQKGTEYSVCAIPLGGYVKLAGDNLEEYKGRSDEFLSRPPRQRAAVIFFGPLLNYLLGFLFFWLIFFIGYPTLTTKVGDLLDGFGAKDAGIKAGDKIIAVEGKRVDYWEDIQKVIYSKKDAEVVSVLLLREGQEYNAQVRIRGKEMDDPLGQKRNVGLLGIMPADEIVEVKHGIIASFFLGLKKTYDLTALTYKALWRLISGKLSMRQSLTGPLGIFYVTAKAAKLGLIAVLHLMAVLSVSLGIFNLLPLPVLDGGHILLLLVEKIRGKPLGLKAEQAVTRIGLSTILTLAVIVTYNDIMRVFGDKISKFWK